MDIILNIFFYIIMFMIGIIIGNFYKYIIHKNKKWLMPLTGILLVLFALSLKLNIHSLQLENIITFIFIAIYLICIILIASTDRNEKNRQKIVLTYGIILSVIYIIYLCIVEKQYMYTYPIYLVLMIILLIVDNLNLKKNAETNYTINMIILITMITIFTGRFVSILTMIATLLAILIYMIVSKIRNSRKNISKINSKNIKIGLILVITNITIFLLSLAYIGIQN